MIVQPFPRARSTPVKRKSRAQIARLDAAEQLIARQRGRTQDWTVDRTAKRSVASGRNATLTAIDAV
ncbi:MAG: hypothetical protein Hens2KO_10240 [Henriciella sp.]